MACRDSIHQIVGDSLAVFFSSPKNSIIPANSLILSENELTQDDDVENALKLQFFFVCDNLKKQYRSWTNQTTRSKQLEKNYVVACKNSIIRNPLIVLSA